LTSGIFAGLLSRLLFRGFRLGGGRTGSLSLGLGGTFWPARGTTAGLRRWTWAARHFIWIVSHEIDPLN
jgi:hypothetical protein